MLNFWEPFQNYIFDMDGTLVDSSLEVLQCLKAACDINGAEINQDNFSSNVIGPPLKEIIQAITVESQNEELTSKIMSDFRRIYDNDENDKSSMYENTYEWLISLKKAGKRIFLATNKPTKPTFRLIRMLKLDFFEDIYTIDKYPEKHITKTEMITEILEKYNLENGSTVMIGDAPSDIKAAHNAGIKGVGVLWGYGDNKQPLVEISDFVINNVQELALSVTEGAL